MKGKGGMKKLSFLFVKNSVLLNFKMGIQPKFNVFVQSQQ